MPTYVYRRDDGTTFEFEQRITDDPLDTCPTTGQAVSRVITGGTGLIFKGSGFYLTDYARKNGSAASTSGASTSTNGSSDTSAEPAKTKSEDKSGSSDS